MNSDMGNTKNEERKREFKRDNNRTSGERI